MITQNDCKTQNLHDLNRGGLVDTHLIYRGRKDITCMLQTQIGMCITKRPGISWNWIWITLTISTWKLNLTCNGNHTTINVWSVNVSECCRRRETDSVDKVVEMAKGSSVSCHFLLTTHRHTLSPTHTCLLASFAGHTHIHIHTYASPYPNRWMTI